MKKLTMMFALSMAVTVLASGGAVRWIDGEKIVVDGDKYAMNWILECDGKQYDFLEPRFKWGTFHHPKELAGKIEDSFSRRQDGDDLVETLVITNISDGPVNLWGATVSLPFNDNYPDAKECVKRRCNAHLWPFGSAAWVCCMRMGGEAPHLGWMLTKGVFDGYEVDLRGRDFGSSNFRGVFSFRIPETALAAGEALTLEWRLFSHTGWDDFFAQLTGEKPAAKEGHGSRSHRGGKNRGKNPKAEVKVHAAETAPKQADGAKKEAAERPAREEGARPKSNRRRYYHGKPKPKGGE